MASVTNRLTSVLGFAYCRLTPATGGRLATSFFLFNRRRWHNPHTMDRSRKKYLSPTSPATTTPSEALQARATTTPSNTRHGSSGHHSRTTIVVASNIMSDIQHASHDMTPLKRKKSSGSTQPLPSMPRNTEEIEVELPDRQTPRSQVTNTSHSQ